MFIERCSVFLSLAVILFSVNAAHSQILPYITDVYGEDGEVISVADGGEDGDGLLRPLGTFKLFNPDTVPFYLWVSFENGGKFTNSRLTKSGERPTVRLVDLEIRYKNDMGRPAVKKFPNARYNGRVRKRFAGSWLGGGRSAKGAARATAAEEADEADAVWDRGGGGRGNWASEIVFWKEDAQGYYEMELWGVLYAPDLKKVTVKGRYTENIKFEIELAR